MASTEDKLAILAAAAKYDVSCASSGSRRPNAGKGLGNAAASGICHSFTEDGRCVSLLKLLFSNRCVFDCAYCANRATNDIPRATFTPAEIVGLTMDFYRRNYIEGLFLSSAIVGSPDATMEALIRVARDLRRQGFNGYVHLKCVPHASPSLVEQAGLVADRLSVNIELPSEASLRHLAGEKSYGAILTPMGVIRDSIAQLREDRKRLRHAPAFAPAGQSTQLIVGASPESDLDILSLADRLYRDQHLKRVYYSAFVPVPRPDPRLPSIGSPPLVRENRLYQADWLIRLYGFALEEVIDPQRPDLDLAIDPKFAFARRHPQLFPVDVNTAPYERILRVPGIGIQSARRIVHLRQKGRIRYEHLKQMGVVVGRALPFLCCDGRSPQPLQLALPRPLSPGSHRPWAKAAASAGPVRRLVFVFDGTFQGLLTAVFEAYATKRRPDTITARQDAGNGLFEHHVEVATDAAKAGRVWKGIKTHLGADRRQMVYLAFLSGDRDGATAIYRFLRDNLPSGDPERPEADLNAQLEVAQLAQKVGREAHRYKGFVRFAQVDEDQYLALIEPRHDVLPLLRRHFQARYADQNWIIYDIKRDYGLSYDRRHTTVIHLDLAHVMAGIATAGDNERLCQTLWRRYHSVAAVGERANPKLQQGKLPRRFWPHLTEMAA